MNASRCSFAVILFPFLPVGEEVGLPAAGLREPDGDADPSEGSGLVSGGSPEATGLLTLHQPFDR